MCLFVMEIESDELIVQCSQLASAPYFSPPRWACANIVCTDRDVYGSL